MQFQPPSNQGTPQPEQYQQPPQFQQLQMQPPPKARPPKKQPPWAWLIGGILVGTIFGYAIHVPGASSFAPATSTTPVAQATSQPTHAAVTPTPTHTPKWTTVQTFNGSGSKHTATFTAPADWKILWTCNPASFAIPYNVIIEVDNASDGSTLDLPVNTTCKAGNTSDSSEEHQGGSVFLNVTSEGDWTIQVQELK